MNKKKKTRSIIFPSFRKNTEIGAFEEKDGRFIFKDSNGKEIIPTSIKVGESYERQNGKLKVISKINTNVEKINLNPHTNNLNYDWLLSIDTNSKQYDNKKISISCSAFINLTFDEPFQIKKDLKQKWDINFKYLDAFVSINPKVNPELIGWQILINWILASSNYNNSLKVGIVVDSELGNLSDFNEGKKPFLGDIFLPKNFELIYASSDVGKDGPNNKMISICDKAANKVWGYIMKNPDILNNLENVNHVFLDGSTIVNADLVYNLNK